MKLAQIWSTLNVLQICLLSAIFADKRKVILNVQWSLDNTSSRFTELVVFNSELVLTQRGSHVLACWASYNHREYMTNSARITAHVSVQAKQGSTQKQLSCRVGFSNIGSNIEGSLYCTFFCIQNSFPTERLSFVLSYHTSPSNCDFGSTPNQVRNA